MPYADPTSEHARATLRGVVRNWRDANPDATKQQDRLRHKSLRARAMLLLGGCCADCGNEDQRVLEFDHVPERGPKTFNIANAAGVAWTLVEAELAKCDLVCANCHAIRTVERHASGK